MIQRAWKTLLKLPYETYKYCQKTNRITSFGFFKPLGFGIASPRLIFVPYPNQAYGRFQKYPDRR